MLWDLFCRVIDNHGDLGVCWRLATALARRGQRVRLWVDDGRALAWLAPRGAEGVQLVPWTDPAPALAPGNAVVEAFGCDPPTAFVAAMASRTPPAVWVNLEYLSAEPYVERSHGLRSPQWAGPGAGLDKWFFYPGFTPRTGGLLHDGGVDGDSPAATHAATEAWLAVQGWAARPEERSVLVFCYDNPGLPTLLAALPPQPTLLRLAPGPMQQALLAMHWPQGLRCVALPAVPQTDFDRLLAASDLNIVRGEDSFVRAQVASDAPFLWQIYPQHDGAHATKLSAFLALYLAAMPAPLATTVRGAFLAVNGQTVGTAGAAGLASAWADTETWAAWASAHRRWRRHLRSGHELCDRLLAFAQEKLQGQR